MWGEEDDPISGTSWSYTFSAKTFNPLNSTQKLAGQCGSTNTGLKWTISAKQSGGSNVSYSGYDSTKGQQIGSGSDSAATASISSSSFSSLSKITSVTVNTSGTSGVVASVSVKVGDKDFKNNNNTSVSISTTATNYEFTGTGAGAVSINWNQSSSKGLYIKSITVVYEIEPSVVATEISVSGSASVNGQGETSVQSTYSYDVTYQAGKTGNKANVEVSVSPAAFAEVGTISNQQFTVTFKRSTTFTITVSSTETANVSGTLDVTVTNVTLEGYIKLSSEVSLYAGAKILIVDETSEVAAGAISNSRLGDEDVTINDGVIPTSGKGDALEFTLGGTVDNWTLTSSEGLLGTKEVKKLVYDDADATTTWTITVSSAVGHEGEATIESTGDGLGKILYNADNYYFANYASAPTSANRLPQIYVKAPENSIYDMIENTMRMGDTALKGDGSGACKNSGYYLAAKAALAALSSADRAKFRDDDGGKYTAALARYNAWALACNDAAPFDGETTVVTTLSSANIVSIFNNTTNVAAIIAIVSVISLSAVAGFFLLRKRKEQ